MLLRPSTARQTPDRERAQDVIDPASARVEEVEQTPAADAHSHEVTGTEPAHAVARRPQIPLDTNVPRTRSTHRQADRASNAGAVVRHSAGEEFFSRSVRSLEPISDLEAASFAGRFATDFQSFDEDDPSRRAEVLRPLLADPQASTWGWSGAGRQRADSPLPGRLYRPADTVVFVEVIVRITTYARACPPPETPRPAGSVEVEVPGLLGPSCAPPEADPAWTAVEANWVRMTVPITRDDDGHLVVDPHLRPNDPS